MKARLLICLLPLGAMFAPTAVAQPKSATFNEIVGTNFQRWDANKDGKLSPHEIAVLVLDPKVTGAEAAAVAAIHHYFFLRSRDEDRKSVTLTKKELLAPEGGKFNHHDGSPDVFHFPKTFHACGNLIHKASHKIFAGESPRLEGIHQKKVGDCYIISVVGASVCVDPARIKQMIHPRKDGSCEVVFGSGQRIVIPKLTDAQIAHGTAAVDQGLWLTVLEEAYAQVRFADETKRRPDDLALDTIAHGGNEVFTIRLLTGHASSILHLNKPKDPDALLHKVRETLKTGQAGKLLMACSVHFDKNAKPDVRPPAINTGHAYGILSFDEKSDKVVVWNPHANNFTPLKQPPGLENGYPTKGGRFEVPLRDFVQIFESITYETNQPAKERETEKKK